MRAAIRARTRSRWGPSGRGPDQPIQAQLAQGAQHGGDVTVGFGADNVEGVVAADEGFVPEQPAQRLDFRGGPDRQVGQRAFAHALAFTPALAQQNGRGRVAVGDDLDVNGND